MDIFGIGIPEILVILVIAMIAVGPEKMVKFASQAGRFVRQFRSSTDEVSREFREAFNADILEEASPGTTEATPPAPAGTGPLATSAGPAATRPPAMVVQTVPSSAPTVLPAVAAAVMAGTPGSSPVASADAPAPSAETLAPAVEDPLAEEPAPAPEPAPVEEPVELADLLGDAFGFGEPAAADEVAPSDGAGDSDDGRSADMGAVEVYSEAVSVPAAEGEPEDAPGAADEQVVAEPVAEPLPSAQAADEPEASKGLDAPIPAFGYDWDADNAEDSDPAQKRG